MTFRTQLLCTFANRDGLYDTVDSIIANYDIIFNKIYIFENEDDVIQFICTYNIEENRNNHITERNTISLHRKKQTNTLYTINALNSIIRDLNNGVLDKSFPIPWEEYANSLVLVNSNVTNVIPIKIYDVINTLEY